MKVRLGCGAAALVALFALVACSEAAPAPQAPFATPQDEPHGPSVEVERRAAIGTVYVASLRFEEEAERTEGDDAPQTTRLVGQCVIEHTIVAAHADGRTAQSSARLAFQDHEGRDVLGSPTENVLTARHETDGRVALDGLEFSPHAEAGVRQFIAGIELCGLAGSSSWIARRDVQTGNVWPVEAAVPFQDAARLQQAEAAADIDFPEPAGEGWVRVEGVRAGPRGRLVDLRLESRVVAEGEVVDELGDDEDRARIPYRMVATTSGTATIDAKSGLPTSLDIRTVRTEAYGELHHQRRVRRLHGTIEELAPRTGG